MLNSATTLIRETAKEAPPCKVCITSFGCSQEKDQLLREERQRPRSRRRCDSRHAMDLDRWMKTLPQPWTAAMEATIFSGWIYAKPRLLFPIFLAPLRALRQNSVISGALSRSPKSAGRSWFARV